MRRSFHVSLGIVALLALAGCGGPKAPEGAVPAIAPDPSAKAAISGILAESLGKGLDEHDRQIAFDAQIAALEKGQRQSWRGKKGSFGIVDLGPEQTHAEGTCRDYTHKIYVGGRPQSGQGQACRQATGHWRFVS